MRSVCLKTIAALPQLAESTRPMRLLLNIDYSLIPAVA